jgi:hypothetical protein
MKRALAHAIAAGELLIEAKGRLMHGRWLPWLHEHCQIPERTAQLYMKLARHAPELKSATVADLTVRAAITVGRDQRGGVPAAPATISHDRAYDEGERPDRGRTRIKFGGPCMG